MSLPQRVLGLSKAFQFVFTFDKIIQEAVLVSRHRLISWCNSAFVDIGIVPMTVANLGCSYQTRIQIGLTDNDFPKAPVVKKHSESSQ